MLENLLKCSLGARFEGAGRFEIPVEEICVDSRKVRQGSLFVAISGHKCRGSDFIEQALRRGASAAVVPQEELAELDTLVPPGFPLIPVDDTRFFAGMAAAELHGHPSKHLKLIGITGTNGKTTITWLLESIFGEAGMSPGVIGTITNRFSGSEMPSALTTPDSVTLQKSLAKMRESGADSCLLEVSSHALKQQRVAGCHFKAALFTNLSRDHLDYHKDMEDYFQAKKLLFTRYKPEYTIINIDDPYGRRLAHELEAEGMEPLTFGIDRGDIRASSIHIDLHGIRALIETPSGQVQISSRLVGAHNLSNILAASAVSFCLDIAPDAISKGIHAVESVPGRLEPVENEYGLKIFVDYAHTPDALEKVIKSLVGLTPGRVVTVAGCGGDRDRGKRPLMAEVAAGLSSETIFTSDNPRTEEPVSILMDMAEGIDPIRCRSRVRVIPDRYAAIESAVKNIDKDDCLLIAGKGHEDYQLVGDKRLHFDDREAVQAACASLAKGAGPVASVYAGADSHLYPVLRLSDVSAGAEAINVYGNSDRHFRALSTDTRKLGHGELFWALRGENFNGNRFVPSALEAGASGAVMDEQALEYLDPEGLSEKYGACIIVVKDTLRSLGRFASFYRKRMGFRVAGITGSCGKTSTRALVSQVASTMYPAAATMGNFNNLIGLPLSMISAPPGTVWGVFEMGMNQRGEMKRLCEISSPDVGIITNIREAHLEGLGTVEAIAAEKWELWKALPAHGTAVLNLDDSLVVRGALQHLKCARIIGWSMKTGGMSDMLKQTSEIYEGTSLERAAELADTVVTCDSWKPVGSGTEVVCTVSSREGESRRLVINLPLPGEANVHNALAAVAAGVAMNIPLDQIAEGLENAAGVPGRLEYARLANGWIIIADFYNANPASMEAALSTLAVYAGRRRKVAVLGDMLELGERSAELHRRLGASAVEAGVDLLLAAGEFAQEIARGACDAGMPAAGIRTFPHTEDLCEWLRDRAVTLLPDDGAMLVKGSRGMRLERAVDIIEELAGGRAKVPSPSVHVSSRCGTA